MHVTGGVQKCDPAVKVIPDNNRTSRQQAEDRGKIRMQGPEPVSVLLG